MGVVAGVAIALIAIILIDEMLGNIEWAEQEPGEYKHFNVTICFSYEDADDGDSDNFDSGGGMFSRRL